MPEIHYFETQQSGGEKTQHIYKLWIANTLLRNTGTLPTLVTGEGVGQGQKTETNSCFKLQTLVLNW